MFSSEDELIFKYLNVKEELFFVLNIVKKYIIENKLIVTGGFALDLSLRSKNSFIYDKFTIPDYDVLSDQHLYHCNTLGALLCNLNRFDVDIINAIHNTTMRIKVFGYTVFDCTYIPSDIINKLPLYNYNNFVLIHPHFQMIDQYLSLSYLFNITGPNYNYNARLKKDYDRNKLIKKYFPQDLLSDLTTNETNLNDITSNKFITITIPLLYLYDGNYKYDIYKNDKKIETISSLTNYDTKKYLKDEYWFITTHKICCGPLLSYLLLIYDKNSNDEIKKLISLDIKNEALIIKINEKYKKIIFPDLMVNDVDYLLNIIQNIESDTKINTLENFTTFKEKNKILDIIPNSYNNNILNVYDITSKNMTLDVVNVKGYNFLICSPMYIVTMFLFKSFIVDDIYTHLYVDVSRYSYITLSSFQTHNLNDEQIWFLNNLYKDTNKNISKPKKNYLKKNDCKIKEDTFNIKESEVYNIS